VIRHAVTLDLWNTLIGEDVGSSSSRRRNVERISGTISALRRAGQEPAQPAIERALAEMHRLVDRDHTRGVDMPFDERVLQLLSLVEPDLPDRVGPATIAAVRSALDEPFLAHPPRLLDGARETLLTLADQGLALGIISNTGLTSPEGYDRFLEGHGLRRLFEVLTLSTGLGAAKPADTMFLETLEALEVHPEAALHVGDSLRSDVAGANRVGMRTVWVSEVYLLSEIDVAPDFTIGGITELPAIVRQWLNESPVLEG